MVFKTLLGFRASPNFKIVFEVIGSLVSVNVHSKEYIVGKLKRADKTVF